MRTRSVEEGSVDGGVETKKIFLNENNIRNTMFIQCLQPKYFTSLHAIA